MQQAPSHPENTPARRHQRLNSIRSRALWNHFFRRMTGLVLAARGRLRDPQRYRGMSLSSHPSRRSFRPLLLSRSCSLKTSGARAESDDEDEEDKEEPAARSRNGTLDDSGLIAMECFNHPW